MSRSQPKPKIIYKNLQQVLRGSSLNKKNSARKSNNKIPLQLLTDLTNRKSNITIQPRKNKFIQQTNPKISKNKDKDNDNKCQQQNNIYHKCYDEIDAIYTQLQDFFCQSKQKITQQIKSKLDNKSQNQKPKNKKIQQQINQKVQDIKKMSNYIKHIVNYFIDGEIPTPSQQKQKQLDQPQPQSTQKKQVSFTKNINTTEQYQDQSSKLLTLSMKNSKVRANRRGELINTRKKTIYQMILQQQENKNKTPNSNSKKML